MERNSPANTAFSFVLKMPRLRIKYCIGCGRRLRLVSVYNDDRSVEIYKGVHPPLIYDQGQNPMFCRYPPAFQAEEVEIAELTNRRGPAVLNG